MPPTDDELTDLRRVVIELPPRQVLRTLLLALAVVLGVLLLWRIHEVAVLVLVAILLATAIEPLVRWLARGPFSRGFGVLIIYSVLVLAIAVPAYLAVPRLLEQTIAFVQELPARLESLRQLARTAPGPIQQAAETAVDQSTSAGTNQAPPTPDQLLGAGLAAAHVVFNVIMVFVVAFYWIVERDAIKRVLLRALPARRARMADQIWLDVEHKIGGWVRGQLVLMLAIGVMSGVAYWALGLPNPLVLAVLAGLLEIVPLVGPVLSAAPAILVAVATDPLKAVLVAGVALVIQQIENNVLVPRVMGHTVGISPLVVLVGILIGAALYGIPGAFLAVPVAGTLQVILQHVLRPHPTSDDTHAGAG